MRALVVDPSNAVLPTELLDVLRDAGWDVAHAKNYADATAEATKPDPAVIVVPAPKPAGAGVGQTEFDRLIDLVEENRVPALVVTDESSPLASPAPSLIESVPPTVSPDELKGRLAMIERFLPVVRRMERETHHLQKLARRLDRHFREVDQEMRLAGRLQRDFLPKLDNPIQGVRFAAIYRPALWVSGDTYDVLRVNEHTSAFYLADAVGHGMAASLLTMSIRRAIVCKRIESDGYRILTPSETMANLNAALVDQGLPNSQFVTACFALLDHRTNEVCFSRGGHPFPVVLTRDGKLREIESSGGLLGVFEDAEFPSTTVQLEPGEKLLVYSDGMEVALGQVEDSFKNTKLHLDAFRLLASLPIPSMLEQLELQLDRAAGSLDPRDDVTVVGLEIPSA